MSRPAIQSLFVTKLYRAEMARARALNTELERTCLAIAREDKAGRRWCREHGYRGYTSYASLDDLPQRAPVFADLEKRLDQHARTFAHALDWNLRARRLHLDSLWINVMERGSVHTGHIHPHSVLSGTYYVTVPRGAAAIKFEDPRLAMMMAAPAKRAKVRAENLSFVTVAPRPGTVLMWESFVRHEVPVNASARRISMSFNFALA